MERNQEKPTWIAQLEAYEKPVTWRAVWQIANTLIPYLGLVVLMYLSVRSGYPAWATIMLSIPAAAFMVRMFVLFHDCSHGSWQHGHGVHHSTSGNLDRRTIGEVWTVTAQEDERSAY